MEKVLCNQTMTYRTMPSTGDQISLLGYGCMRFRKKGKVIDEKRAERQVRIAIKKGVNYFDTAYLYPGNEEVLGRILEKGLRDQIYLATKLPHLLIHSRADFDLIFQIQLERLKTNYIDYYLIHSLSSINDWEKLKEKGFLDFLQKKREQNSLHHLGFSYHGNSRDFMKIIDDYPWEFCQIQYNYLDEFSQAGRIGLEYASEKGIGVIIMEPLRGGLLGAKMPNYAWKMLKGTGIEPATLALRFSWEHQGVQVVLSGMNEEMHIDENCSTAKKYGNIQLGDQELSVIKTVKELFQQKEKVSCTACSYCMPCPFGVDIPTCFSCYNSYSIKKRFMTIMRYYITTEGKNFGKPSRASLCKSCGACEKKCPQGIDIRKHLEDTVLVLEKASFRIPLLLYMKLLRFRKK